MGMMGVMAEAAPIPSWTRTLNEEDALTLLDLARAGETVASWAQAGSDRLPQANLPRRREQLRIVREELLDHAGGCILDSAFLRLMHDGSPHRRQCLLYGRLFAQRPLVRLALDELVHPALAIADRPLAPEDADLIAPDVWDRFLRGHLRPGIPREAFLKTRSTLQGALRDLGVIEFSDGRQRLTRVRHGRPEPIAFAWVAANELVTSRRDEVPEPWAARESMAARLFAPRADYALSCLEAGVGAGLLRRGFLLGQPRLHPGIQVA